MQIQQNPNNQPSFKSFKVSKSAVDAIKQFDLMDNFKKEMPSLKNAAKAVDVKILYMSMGDLGNNLVYRATPKNKFKMNNFFSYAYNLIKNRVGRAECPPESQKNYIDKYPEQYSFLSIVEKAKEALANKIPKNDAPLLLERPLKGHQPITEFADKTPPTKNSSVTVGNLKKDLPPDCDGFPRLGGEAKTDFRQGVKDRHSSSGFGHMI